MSATQMAVLFVLAVLAAAASMNPDLLIATVEFAKEGNLMVKEVIEVLFKAVYTCVSAIWCSCIAAGAVPRFI